MPTLIHLAGFFSGLLGVLLVGRNNPNSFSFNAFRELYLTYTISGLPNLLGTFLGLGFLTIVIVGEYFDRGSLRDVYGIPGVWLVIVVGIGWWVWTLYAMLIWRNRERR